MIYVSERPMSRLGQLHSLSLQSVSAQIEIVGVAHSVARFFGKDRQSPSTRSLASLWSMMCLLN